MNIDFLKGLQKKTTRDGQPPKRRGPKPDSKPATTRRQELNRQAQRTHRERKELYIKNLELEVSRLKDNVSILLCEKDSVAQENEVLKQLLIQNGITLPDAVAHRFGLARDDSSVGANTPGSIDSFGAIGAGNPHAPRHGIGPTHLQGANGTSGYNHPNVSGNGGLQTAPGQGGLPQGADYETIGIDFVLAYVDRILLLQSHIRSSFRVQNRIQDFADMPISSVVTSSLERPCRDHMPYLLKRAQEPDGEICGHAFMVSCPPESHAIQTPDVAYAPTRQELHDQLGTLLEMSRRLDLDGEATPVMAWGMIMDHPRVGEITPRDFELLRDELGAKIRCYGFGAVLEGFEVQDALSSIFATKIESYASFT
ncbi:MAG: hypothetical protein M4579_005961 [Chaenotheca gracillima]|nr:MAG: hypothetical protein M4579_005961 [Chaenotheca gracillima]